MALQSIIAGVLAFLLLVALGFSYLLYVRMQDVRQELEMMRSKVEVHEEELDNIESSLDSVDLTK